MLAYKLVAHGIGGRSVQELSDTMDVEEFLTWGVYLSIEPFGEDRADWRNAQLISYLVNMNRGKGQSAIPANEFLLNFEKRSRRRKSIEELKTALDVQLVHGGGERPQR